MSYQDTAAPLQFDYDVASDILTVNGVKYTGEMFRSMALAPAGTWLRLDGRSEDGAKVFIRTVSPELERTFDAAIGIGVE